MREVVLAKAEDAVKNHCHRLVVEKYIVDF